MHAVAPVVAVSAILAASATLAGCATAEPGPGLDRSTTMETISVTYPDGDSRGVTITRTAHVSRAEITAPRRHVWNALPDAYRDVDLPLPVLDTDRRIAAVQNHRVVFRLGGERLSRYFDCGMGPTGLNADQRSLRMDVYVALLPEIGDGVTPVEIRADAAAQSTEGASAARVQCTSSGLLEQRLATALQLRALQAPTPDGGRP